MSKSCARCGKTNKGTVGLRISKTEVSLCPICFNQWLDERDEAVEKAFKRWMNASV